MKKSALNKNKVTFEFIGIKSNDLNMSVHACVCVSAAVYTTYP